MRKVLMAAGCFVALAACGQTAPPATTETPVAETPTTPLAPINAVEATAQDTCGAAQYRALVGTNVAAASFPADANIRIIPPRTPVTQDFSAARLNVLTDATGVIASLECY